LKSAQIQKSKQNKTNQMNTFLKSSIASCLLFLSTSFAHAQVGVGTTSPAASAQPDRSASTIVVKQ
jgi:hypothetical protein